MSTETPLQITDARLLDGATDVNDSGADAWAALLDAVETLRLTLCRTVDERHRAEMGQFLTPMPVAQLMASLFMPRSATSLHLLDAGAGIGSLSAAWIAAVCGWARRPAEITVTAYDIDAALIPYLHDTFRQCAALCEQAGVTLRAEVRQEDFIRAGAGMIRDGLFAPAHERFDCAILNPPYRKIHSNSETRRLLRGIGVETSNLYTGFLALITQLLKPGGEMVAITPRSFCNGPYFRPFRRQFLQLMSPQRFHVFDTRDRAFRDDNVLQETIIMQAVKEASRTQPVLISSSASPDDPDMRLWETALEEIVSPDDPDHVIHLMLDEMDHKVAERMERCRTALSTLGLAISTGRVVGFRARPSLRDLPGADTVPLIYPEHCVGGRVRWPRPKSRKPQAIAVTAETEDLLVPSGTYVLVKRFTTKEERRRIVATIYDPTAIDASRIGFENHLNYYHRRGQGLPPILARGLAAFLNSSVVDAHFRQFSGHTQVNATDLRKLRYPTREALEALGERIGTIMPHQDELDQLINEELLRMPTDAIDPIQAARKISEAKEILKALDLPQAQQNERSALTLLALLDLKPGMPWPEANAPLRGITPMMEFIKDHYGKAYAPNTRETVRRFTAHQFMDAGLIIANPDQPARPVNSPLTVYQIEPDALYLLGTYGSEEWEISLDTYLASRQTLQDRYAQERAMARIPVTLSSGAALTLSSGGQNVLIKQVIDEFCPLFTPGGTVLYVGDTDEKFAHFDRESLQDLGVTIEEHGKMPDVIIHHAAKNWLVLIEAVTSHGPINPKRRGELSALFKASTAPLVYVTTFLSRRAMVRYLGDISWETEVWVAESPTHLIHFNGERFLGPR